MAAWGYDITEFYNTVSMPDDVNGVTFPGCFATEWAPRCVDFESGGLHGSAQYWGGCNGVTDLATFLGDPDTSHGTVYSTDSSGASRGAYWYMDANCHWTSLKHKTKICGVAALCASPISLLWDENASLTDSMTVVPFSIDASRPEAFSLWKASEKAPLLVYDPTHTGKVTSAKQLFGTYTFGGRTTKAAYYQSDEARTPWDNGYEALALLDTNRDGKLSGKELDPLALWFDKNRDGVSQPGEVESLSALGVTALYYKPDRTDPKSGDIQANFGYERLVDGKLIKGASVDWFANTFSTKQEATVALSAIFQQEKRTGGADDELGTRGCRSKSAARPS